MKVIVSKIIKIVKACFAFSFVFTFFVIFIMVFKFGDDVIPLISKTFLLTFVLSLIYAFIETEW